MKVEELTAGVRSNTRLVLVYMKELVYPEVLEQIPADKRDALLGVLRSDPRPSYQHDPERLYGLSFGGVEVKFKVDGDVLTVVSTGKLKKNK